MSGYSDNHFKFAVIVNRKFESPRLLNATSHLMAGMISSFEDRDKMKFLAYSDKHNQLRAHISTYPVVILAAKNSSQLKNLRHAALEAELEVSDFVDTMLGTSAEMQLEATRSGDDNSFEVLACLIWGPSHLIDPLTRKYSLYKGDSMSLGEPNPV